MASSRPPIIKVYSRRRIRPKKRKEREESPCITSDPQPQSQEAAPSVSAQWTEAAPSGSDHSVEAAALSGSDRSAEAAPSGSAPSVEAGEPGLETKPPMNYLLAGYIAHEFLTRGTLFGQKFVPAEDEAEDEAGSSAKSQAEEVASIVSGTHIPGVVNPSQLSKWMET